MKCSGCPNWSKGRGTEHCLKCEFYRQICLESGKRKQISIQSVPEMILDNIPYLPDEARAIERIGLEYSTPIIQKYLLGAKLNEIAEYHKESVGNVQRKIRFGIRMIRKIKS